MANVIDIQEKVENENFDKGCIDNNVENSGNVLDFFNDKENILDDIEVRNEKKTGVSDLENEDDTNFKEN